MSSLKKLKRRLSWTLRGRGTSVDESLSDLAETLTIEENGGIKENGKFCLMQLFYYYISLNKSSGNNIVGSMEEE